jgi:tRNA(fMet)-specific endonuclease VapC
MMPGQFDEMIYVLDTNICDLLMEKRPVVVGYLESLHEDSDTVATTIISFDESVSGWLPFCHRANNGKVRAGAYARLQNVWNFYREMLCLPFDNQAGVIFDQLRAQKIRVGTNDLAIAAITLSVSGVIVTRNQVDFEKVPGLTLEDWSR